MTGMILNIQRFCINDGPGIRTTVFFKGCPLRCDWCHNPEGQNPEKQWLFYPDKCTHCGKCKSVSVQDAGFFCPVGAKEICGKTVTAEEIITEVMKDYEFYKNSGGGITLSGGEPLFQFAFALELLKKAKENNLHTAVETCGYGEKSELSEIARFTDVFLFDFKESNPKFHKAYTGADNGRILENLFLLNALKKETILRFPVVPGYNDRQENYDEICRLANTLASVTGIEIEPYHAFGGSKYTALGKPAPEIAMQTKAQIEEIIRYIGERTEIPVKQA